MTTNKQNNNGICPNCGSQLTDLTYCNLCYWRKNEQEKNKMLIDLMFKKQGEKKIEDILKVEFTEEQKDFIELMKLIYSSFIGHLDKLNQRIINLEKIILIGNKKNPPTSPPPGGYEPF